MITASVQHLLDFLKDFNNMQRRWCFVKRHTRGYLVNRLHHLSRVVMQKASSQPEFAGYLAYAPRHRRDVSHADALYITLCCHPKPSGSHLIRRSSEICWLALEKNDDLSRQQHSLRYWHAPRISEGGVMNHIHRHLAPCCPGSWKETDRVPDIYGSVQGCFMALVIGCRVRAF